MNDAKQATPHHELIASVLDPCIPKTEREWAARREIEALRARVQELERELLRQQRESAQEARDAAIERGWQERQGEDYGTY